MRSANPNRFGSYGGKYCTLWRRWNWRSREVVQQSGPWNIHGWRVEAMNLGINLASIERGGGHYEHLDCTLLSSDTYNPCPGVMEGFQ